MCSDRDRIRDDCTVVNTHIYMYVWRIHYHVLVSMSDVRCIWLRRIYGDGRVELCYMIDSLNLHMCELSPIRLSSLRCVFCSHLERRVCIYLRLLFWWTTMNVFFHRCFFPQRNGASSGREQSAREPFYARHTDSRSTLTDASLTTRRLSCICLEITRFNLNVIPHMMWKAIYNPLPYSARQFTNQSSRTVWNMEHGLNCMILGVRSKTWHVRAT